MACGEEEADPVALPDPPRPTSISVTPTDSLIPLRDTLRLLAVVRDQHDRVISDWAPDWISSHPSVASVRSDGLVTGLQTGSAEIYATAGDAEGSATVGVEFQVGPLGTLAVSGMGCALDEAGSAYCWGAGLLGNGDSVPSELPVAVAGGHTFEHLSAIDAHVCGLTKAARVLCWGANRYGESDPTSLERGIRSPVEIAVPGTPVQAVAGGEFSCTLLEDGRAVCWGRNNEAQLGRGSTSAREGPGEVAGNERFEQLALGRSHGCGITSSGAAHCWGRNQSTQLGDGTTTMALTPIAADTDVRFSQISATEEYTCAVGLDGLAYCWGHSSSGRLGNGSGPYDGRPVRVVDLEGVTQVDAGWYHACALDAQGSAHCWGWNISGGLGVGSTQAELYSSDRALAVAGGLSFIEISVGVGVTCGRTASYQIYCWGDNLYGGLGIGDAAYEIVPIEIPGGISWATVEAGRFFGCGIDDVGTGYCWGEGYSPNGEGPIPLTGGHVFVDLSVGEQQACGITGAGQALCWGNSGAAPSPIASDSSFVDIDVGVEFACAVTASGQTYCWGDKNFNRMGDGGASGGGGTTSVPVPGALGVSLTSVSTGMWHACGLDATGTAYCWGTGLGGALGTGSDSESLPAPVSGGHEFQLVEAGDRHTCGLDVGGAAWCWGSVNLLGTGTTSGSSVPVAVSGGLTWLDLGVGKRHTCGVEATGQTYCWGFATYGEIGDGSFQHRLTPTAAALEPSAAEVSAAIAGFFDARPASCAVLQDGRAACWGWNDRGQLAEPVIPSSTVPVPLTTLP